jgi:hypothetical protein
MATTNMVVMKSNDVEMSLESTLSEATLDPTFQIKIKSGLVFTVTPSLSEGELRVVLGQLQSALDVVLKRYYG